MSEKANLQKKGTKHAPPTKYTPYCRNTNYEPIWSYGLPLCCKVKRTTEYATPLHLQGL